MPEQDVAVELFYSGAWNDLASLDDVYADTPIVITRGASAEGGGLKPSSISCRLDNTDDRYRVSNPESPLYGLVGRNTPIRVSVGGTVRGVGEVASWGCDQTRDFRPSPKRGRAWTDLDAGGLLRRINQWSDPVVSPFTAYNRAKSGLIGYWPHEQPKGSSSLVSTVPGTYTRLFSGVEFERDRFAGSAPLATLPARSGAVTSGIFARSAATETDGWEVSFCVKLGDAGDTGDFISPFGVQMLNGDTYSLLFVDGADLVLLVTAKDGTTLIDNTQALSGFSTDWALWQCFIIRATYSAGTTTVRIYLNTEGSDDFITWSATFAGNPSQPRAWQSSARLDADTGFGHVIGQNTPSGSMFISTRLAAFQGYPRETPAERFARLCTARNVPYDVQGASATLMGPQLFGTLPEQFGDLTRTEDGLLFDAAGASEVVFRLREDRYNQTPALTLTPADFKTLPREVTDDLGTANVVTVKQSDGGEFTAEDSTGPMGSQDPPDGVGEQRKTVDVNVFNPDGDLEQVANWWLYKGTVALPRFPQVTVDLGAVPALVADTEAVDIGDVITITGFREYTIRLWVLGIKEVIGTHSRSITFTCEPDQQYVTGEYDDGVARYDSGSTTSAEAMTTTETDWNITTADAGDVWSTTDVPYGWLVGGELVTVTAITAPAGSGPYTQTATVTRSVNGIVKTHAIGAEVHVATPGRWGL